jgi:hypothetical protein
MKHNISVEWWAEGKHAGEESGGGVLAVRQAGRNNVCSFFLRSNFVNLSCNKQYPGFFITFKTNP